MARFVLLELAIMVEEVFNANADVEGEVWGAIAAFEQILEAMPEDTPSLAALAHAYGQIGDHSRATDYFLRLGNALVSENDEESALQLLDKLQPYADDSRIQNLITRISSMGAGRIGAGDQAGAMLASSVRHIDVEALNHVKITEELSLAWSLLESGELTQDEYASVVQDLSEMSGTGDDATVSVLHVLEARGFKGFDRVLGFLSRDSGTPFVSLGSYDFQFLLASVLPLRFCLKRGAYAFESVGKDLLVAILNPHDPKLRADVELITARTCHFYLTLPSEFDQALTRYRETIEHDGSS